MYALPSSIHNHYMNMCYQFLAPSCAIRIMYVLSIYWIASLNSFICFIVLLSQIVTQPANTSSAAPFSGVFTCSVSGYGYQMFTWRKQPGTLPHKHKTTETTSHGIITSTLIIPNVTEEDVGKYSCQVWANNFGVKSNKAVLHYAGSYIYMYAYNYVMLCIDLYIHSL